MQSFIKCVGLGMIFLLTSCTLLHTTKEEDREARCKILNRDIIFNGATADQTVATTERAQMETLVRGYHEEDCDNLQTGK